LTPTRGQPNAIFLYHEDGQLNKRIRLPQDMFALNAVETVDETYVVSTDDGSLKELSDEGVIIRVYDGAMQLTSPRYLTTDVNNNILVADERNKGVLLLNKSLKLEQFLLEIPTNVWFNWLFYSHQSGKLYVCCGNRINVYALASV
jgi:hypothetical protein